ncbi:hypothetical protein BSY19_5157 (plasmid) [Bosea sp. RAC05]|nr:hypothetical protein BSY19_5157 [Bosea sp. RAC05]
MGETSVREAIRLIRQGDDARRSIGIGATEEEIQQADFDPPD